MNYEHKTLIFRVLISTFRAFCCMRLINRYSEFDIHIFLTILLLKITNSMRFFMQKFIQQQTRNVALRHLKQKWLYF